MTGHDAAAVLVTGASRGIGRAISYHAARAGCSVAINFRDNASAAEVTRRLCEEARTSDAQQFVTVQADISVADDRERLIDTSLRALGRLDMLVNNAGVAPMVRVDVTQTTEESFSDVLRTNLAGPFFLSQMIANLWLAEAASTPLPGGRCIVNIGSVSAHTVSLNRAEYCIAKAGLAMASQIWAARLAPHGVSVIELRPGIMATDMTAAARQSYDARIAAGLVPQARWGHPDDVARAVTAIIRGDFPFSAGAVIDIDGGLHLRSL